MTVLRVFLFAVFCASIAPAFCSRAFSDEAVTNQTDVIVVRGADGTAEYGDQFDSWIQDWNAVTSTANASLQIIGIKDDDTSDLDSLQASIQSLSKTGARPIWIIFIGHGTYSKDASKFNLRGPDVSAKQLAEWLKPIKRPLVIVNCASSSSPFINRLSAKNRVIVTATKSGSQYNFARFGEYFAKAISSIDSDLDHDDEVSVHEAFLRASSEVKQFYEAAARISTEHALIDDNGDKRGTPAKMFRGARVIAKAKGGAKVDGKLASKISLSPVGSQLKFTDEQLRQRQDLETKLEQLRAVKATTEQDEYQGRLEKILVQLAKIYRAAEQGK